MAEQAARWTEESMARGINKVILVGNLGADPETRYTPSGSAITNVRLATTESWRDRQTGENQERTEWHRIVFFNRLAEIAGEYLRKGSQIYIEGKLQTRKWQDQSGQDRYTTEVVANEMQMLGGRPSGSRSEFGQPSASSQSSAAAAQSKPAEVAQSQQDGGVSDDFEDDIPF